MVYVSHVNIYHFDISQDMNNITNYFFDQCTSDGSNQLSNVDLKLITNKEISISSDKLLTYDIEII